MKLLLLTIAIRASLMGMAGIEAVPNPSPTPEFHIWDPFVNRASAENALSRTTLLAMRPLATCVAPKERVFGAGTNLLGPSAAIPPLKGR
jgi:hypothetical protein